MKGQNPVRWFEIAVRDMPRARRFYETVCDAKLERLTDTPDMEYWTFPTVTDKFGTGGALVKSKESAPGTGGTLVYFACDDCAVEAARVVPAGGKIEHDKMPIGEHGFIALARDTEGNRFGLHSMR
jgi:uncharacterized protein